MKLSGSSWAAPEVSYRYATHGSPPRAGLSPRLDGVELSQLPDPRGDRRVGVGLRVLRKCTGVLDKGDTGRVVLGFSLRHAIQTGRLRERGELKKTPAFVRCVKLAGKMIGAQ
jgi:hypothetical protein